MTEVNEFILNAFRTGEMAATICNIMFKGQAIDQAGNNIIIDQDEVDRVVDKLCVERVDLAKGPNIPQPLINLYLLDVDYTNDEWNLLHKAASKTAYVHDLHGVGRYFPAWTCALYHGVTHPTGMCPYLQIEDDVPMTDPIVQPYTKAHQKASGRRGGTPRGHEQVSGRGSQGRGGGPYGWR